MSELGIQKMQEYLDYYIDEVNRETDHLQKPWMSLWKSRGSITRHAGNRRIVKTANFPFIKTVEDFDFDFQPDINKKEILELNTLRFLDRHDNILFVGSSGTGKTHLATAIGISCAKARNITYFITFEKLMNQLKSALHENRLETRLKFLQSTRY